LFEGVVNADGKEIFVDLRESKLGVYINIADKKRTSSNCVKVPLASVADLVSQLNKAAAVGKKHTPTVKANAEPREPRERKPRIEKPEPPVTESARTVFVSDLAFETTDTELREHLAKAGKITQAFINTRVRKGKLTSSGSGVVEFKTIAEAKRAITELNGTVLDGREIRCREDRPLEERPVREPRPEREAAAPREAREPRERRAKKEPIDRENEPIDPTKVFVTNLSYDTTVESLTKAFRTVGDVVHCEVPMRGNRNRGHGIVEFSDSDDAQAAIDRLDGRDVDGRQVSVRAYHAN